MSDSSDDFGPGGDTGDRVSRRRITVCTHAGRFRQGLTEGGLNEDQNLAIEYRWAEGQFHWLPAMAADLIRRRVSNTRCNKRRTGGTGGLSHCR